MDQVVNTLITTAGTILCALITALGAIVMTYIYKLRQKAQAEINKIDNENTQAYLSNMLDTVYNNLCASVDKVEVGLAKTLKETTEDGKLTKEDQALLAQTAMELCKSITGEEIMNSLEQVVGDTETYLLTLIDSIVLKKKIEGADSNAAATTKNNYNLYG